ncbi:MAG TPA: DUF1326 domain-containing protein [Candidatus Eisenbacteria bacterium]|nr:DUF1326 domain-containing protein [Candidatus Eisenbacteria bacterium]
MKKLVVPAFAVLGVPAAIAFAQPKAEKPAGAPAWNLTATAIEACSCPMFCQCYFSTEPAAHHDMAMGEGHSEHYCRFNNAYMVNKGTYGTTRLDGAKFWIYGDLGGDFSKGMMDWAVVTFDKGTTPAQREAIGAILPRLFPVHWNSLKTAEGEITWVHSSKDEAYALLDGGRTAEVRLSVASLNRNLKGEPMVLRNMKYWGSTTNDGFVMMPNTIEALRAGDKTYEYKGTNGFMITYSLDSKTAPPAMTGM